MVDYVVLKRLTEKSDLGWFHSIYTNRGLKGHQKGITINKLIVNPIWPNLQKRQAAYEEAKQAAKAANAPGGAGTAAAKAERAKARAVGHLPIHVHVYGPENKPPISAERPMALQDKNWRLNGAFIEDPEDDPARFDPTLQEGDLALIGFDGVEAPTRAVVLLLAKSTSDITLVNELSPFVAKGPGSMVKLEPAVLLAVADKLGLSANHIIRSLTGDPVIDAALEEIAQGDISAAAKVRARRPNKTLTAEELATAIAANSLTGQLGEVMANAWLASNLTEGRTHKWMWPNSAAHPYDFEVVGALDAVEYVIDAKSTTSIWTANFYVSSAELAYAAVSSVPYYVYRLSEVGPAGAWLRMSGDIRSFAALVLSALGNDKLPGVRVTTIAVSPDAPGLTWSEPRRLPPAQ